MFNIVQQADGFSCWECGQEPFIYSKMLGGWFCDGWRLGEESQELIDELERRVSVYYPGFQF